MVKILKFINMIKQGYSYNDISLVPAVISDISSRSECNVYYDNNTLPIFASCMSTVVSDLNYTYWEENNITPIIPRNIDINNRLDFMIKGKWVAMSMTEFEKYFIKCEDENLLKRCITYKVCVDIANGHMKSLYELCRKAKEESLKHSYKLSIMTGNIANPKTYDWICNNMCTYYNSNIKTYINDRVIDYIRVSIGTGSQCTTSSNTSVHYPVASLIQECREFKDKYEREWNKIDYFPKIVADGGIRNYSDVIKALGLGADYVMIGGLFAGMYESAAPLLAETNKYNYNGQFIGTEQVLTDYQYTNEEKKRKDIKNRRLYKECYGMSTKKAQELIDPDKAKKTAEGKHSIVEVKYTIKQWTENMIDYLKSAMSYCNSHNLLEFIGKQEFILNSPGTMMAVNK